MTAQIFQPADPNGLHLTVVPIDSWFIVPRDWFVVESPLGTLSFCRFTGRTRRMWGIDFPTVERFTIETVVRTRADGVDAIFGVAGDRIPGMWAMHPNAVEQFTTSDGVNPCGVTA